MTEALYGTGIGRTGGKISHVLVEGIINALFQNTSIYSPVPALLQLQPGKQHLHPYMVLLVYHYTHPAVLS